MAVNIRGVYPLLVLSGNKSISAGPQCTFEASIAGSSEIYVRFPMRFAIRASKTDVGLGGAGPLF